MARETRPYEGITQSEFLCKIAPDIIQYVNWYAEDGMFLPQEYSADPAGWTEVLREIEAAFKNLLDGVDTKEEIKLMYNGFEKYYTYSKYLFKP